MAKNHGPQIKDDEVYEELKKKKRSCNTSAFYTEPTSKMSNKRGLYNTQNAAQAATTKVHLMAMISLF